MNKFLILAALLMCGCSNVRKSLVVDGKMEIIEAVKLDDGRYHFVLTDGKTAGNIDNHGSCFSLFTDEKFQLGDVLEFKVVQAETTNDTTN